MGVRGIGVDIVEVERMRMVLSRTPRFELRVFTPAERAYCAKRANPAASYAGFFAAREAVLKALGVGFGAGVGFADVSVDHDEKGAPIAVLHGGALHAAQERGVVEVHLSISHTHEVAVANAVATTAVEARPNQERPDERALVAARFKEVRSLLDELDKKGSDA